MMRNKGPIVAALGMIAMLVANGWTAGAVETDGSIDQVFETLEASDGVRVAQAPETPGVSGQLLIEPAEEGPITFEKKLDLSGTPMNGHSIEELIVGTPLFPPIEGLDKGIWEGKPCGTCHQWTRERLCTQAKTYVGADKMVARLQHPYGVPFKQVLESWAETGCQ